MNSKKVVDGEQEEYVTKPYADFVLAYMGLVKYLNFIDNKMKEDVDTQLSNIEGKEIKNEEEMSDGFEINLDKAAQRLLDDQVVYENLIIEMILSRAIDGFLTYMADMLALIFTSKPETLKSNDTMKYDDILSYGSMEELVHEMAESRVRNLTYGGFEKLHGYFKEKLNFDLLGKDEDFDSISVIVAVRNLCVHKRGIIDKIFSDKVSKTHFVEDGKKPIVGKRIDLSRRAFYDSLGDIYTLASSIDDRASIKFSLDRPIAYSSIVDSAGI